jgi:arginyl-tRNA synthetase
MAHLEGLLAERMAAAFHAVADAPADPALRRSGRADFQADGALALARRVGRPPRELATAVVAAADLGDLCASVEVAGPGFINLTVAGGALGRLLVEAYADERLGTPPAAEPETVVIDYSGPNAAKEMHVGHLRSSIIGDAAARLLEWQGHRVIRANHLGDWGTPFGMLIEHLLDVGEAAAAHELDAGDLSARYRAARAKFDADAAFRDRARRRVVALQAGDPVTRRLWRRLVAESQRYLLAAYDRLGLTLTAADFRGESFYADRLAPVVDELDGLGLLRDSDGAACAFPAGFHGRDGRPVPLIVRKRDGGFGYAATDLAAVRHRTRDLGARRLLYVIGLPQRQHLEMVFEVARGAGWLADGTRVTHVAFGSVLGADGRMLASRSGVTVRLSDLLDEAVARARATVDERSPQLPERERAAVAEAVGIGAVKYADLSVARTRDYTFDLDRMVSLDGNTAPYLQYAHARIRSILRRAGGAPAPSLAGPAAPESWLAHPAERALALELLAFPSVVTGVADDLEFHRLAGYLFGLAGAFTGFYESCPVLRAEPGIRAGRLALCDLTARMLTLGLGFLGIAAPDRM